MSRRTTRPRNYVSHPTPVPNNNATRRTGDQQLVQSNRRTNNKSKPSSTSTSSSFSSKGIMTVKDKSFLSYEKKDDRTSLQHRSYLWDHLTSKHVDNKDNKAKFTNNKNSIKHYTDVKKEFKAGTSRVTFLTDKSNNMIVKKEYIWYNKNRGRPFNPTESYENELNCLKLLYGCRRFPKLLYHDDKDCCIYMSYCGERIDKHNTPSDWKKQLLKIYDALKERHIYNNDVYINNFCVNDGLISLIDFGLAKQHSDFCFCNL